MTFTRSAASTSSTRLPKLRSIRAHSASSFLSNAMKFTASTPPGRSAP
jgi:hypothetical protein